MQIKLIPRKWNTIPNKVAAEGRNYPQLSLFPSREREATMVDEHPHYIWVWLLKSCLFEHLFWLLIVFY